MRYRIPAALKIALALSLCGALTNMAQEKPLTNAEIIRQVKAHRPDAEIIRGIGAARQSGNMKFDVTPSALIELHNAGVSSDVLKAMIGDGDARPAATAARSHGEVSSGPIGSPPAQKLEADLLNSLQHSNRIIQAGASSKNPKSSMIAILQRQSESIRAVTDSPGGNTPIQPQRTMGFGNVSAAGAIPNSRLQIPCNSPNITAVNRSPAGIYFSPVEPYNRYVIQGCFPGDVPKAVYLRAASTFSAKPSRTVPLAEQRIVLGGQSTINCIPGSTLALVVDFPGSIKHQASPADPHKEIDVHVPPCVTGALDQEGDSVTVVVEYANGQKAELRGFDFFAARETVDLVTVPKSHVTLGGGVLVPTDGSMVFKYVSPVPQSSAAILRDSHPEPNSRTLTQGEFPPASDTFNLNGLKLGFAVLEPQLKPLLLTEQLCQSALGRSDVTVGDQGAWGINWSDDPLTFLIAYREGSCLQKSTLGMTTTGQPLFVNATYAIRIPVEGPRGVAPWPDGSR